MSEPNGGGESEGDRPTGDDARMRSRLKALDDRLAAFQPDPPEQEPGATSGMRGGGLALRVATELVAGAFVGGAIGWLLDSWLNTSPWGLLVLMLSGLAGGLLNALRQTGLVAEAPWRKDRDHPKGDGN